MHPDLEGVGGLVSAGLVAGEIDAVSMPKQAPAHAHGLCGNCGADVAGAYCSACGQSGHLHRSLWHLSEEFLHGVLHFDAKGYRTLPLLVGRPGVLTRRYIDGQRTRYVSPLALFLFCMFLVYFVFSLATEHGLDHSRIAEQDLGAAKADVARARKEIDASVAQAEAALEAARKSGSGVKEAEAELSEAKLGRSISSLSLGVADAAIARSDQADRTVLAAGDAGSPVPTWQEQLSSYAKEHGDASGLKGKWMRALSNPDLTLYKLKNTSYKFSFMLIPISLPFLWLLFAWRRGVAMYDHAVFSLYSLSFMSLLFTAAALISMAGLSSVASDCVIFIPPIHMFLQLRGTYGLGIFSALWRTIALLAVCGTVFLLFLFFVLMMTVH
jgi:hypothetical protein